MRENFVGVNTFGTKPNYRWTDEHPWFETEIDPRYAEFEFGPRLICSRLRDSKRIGDPPGKKLATADGRATLRPLTSDQTPERWAGREGGEGWLLEIRLKSDPGTVIPLTFIAKRKANYQMQLWQVMKAFSGQKNEGALVNQIERQLFQLYGRSVNAFGYGIPWDALSVEDAVDIAETFKRLFCEYNSSYRYCCKDWKEGQPELYYPDIVVFEADVDHPDKRDRVLARHTICAQAYEVAQ
jgi:hypothetical protein